MVCGLVGGVVPKRRVRSAAQIAAQRKASRAAANARRSYSHPLNKKARQVAAYKRGELASTPPGFGGRRSKLGGKGYVAKTATNFKPAAEASAILAGSGTFRNRATSDRQSHAAMLPLVERDMGHPKVAKVPVPKPSWAQKPPGYKGPSQLHGSGTGLSSAFRYAKPIKKRSKK